jgi:multicomponent Na+:H+ antiporter subunit E
MRRTVGIRTLTAIAWSVVVWSALWVDLSPANVLAGVLVGLVTIWLVPLRRPERVVPIRPVAALYFAFYFLWSLVKASAIVAWEVVTPRNRIHQGIVAVPLTTHSPGLITVIGNSISLTPGTLTLEIRQEPPTLYVHVLHLRTLEDVRADIHRLERIVLRAFGPREPDLPT